jgi:predicted RNA binding protein YcfA (HicA-like mRNA interferase family)
LGKLRVLSGDEVRGILESEGFRKVRQRGSHCVMQRSTEDGSTITVPIPLHKTIRRGTLLSIVRQSGLSRDKFESQ